jgi:H+/Cl- antiporter ClcA
MARHKERVTFLVTTIASEASGHGVPEVMDAIYNRERIIRPIVAVVKSLSSGLSIGRVGWWRDAGAGRPVRQ